MKPAITLLQLNNLLGKNTPPSQLRILLQNNQHLHLINTCNQLCARLVTETERDALSMSKCFSASLRQKGAMVIRLLDTLQRLYTAHPDLQCVYQPVLERLLNVHDTFRDAYTDDYTAGQKIPDIRLQSHIRHMQAAYHNLLQSDKENLLLKAVLSPVSQLIRHSSKGNNTDSKVEYAQVLLLNVRLWRFKKLPDSALYEIAVAMNINCRELLHYLKHLGEELLTQEETHQKKTELIHQWNHQHNLARCSYSWRKASQPGFDTTSKPLAEMITEWIHLKKTALLQTPADAQPVARLCTSENGEYVGWWIKVITEAGFSTNRVVAHSIRILAQVISLPGSVIPSTKHLEQIASNAAISITIKKKLIEFGNDFLRIVNLIPVKGQRTQPTTKQQNGKTSRK
ncbi:hypothetical protein HNQ91_002516 [Filimonas zeae]|uniref:Uncharacterized protein n=1 Tax=Filimonas zeae TaxID=1737353 RepID=A0A917IW02_9BACT|nr:hypothetical protein [Filimonas zeae]MDR6339465.1 hypothetical protein [Filimonas zeae]GGH63485.1 hypothetical protein GCM10011379_14440 [Filimonas zeae]